jgi:hypothetical protein
MLVDAVTGSRPFVQCAMTSGTAVRAKECPKLWQSTSSAADRQLELATEVSRKHSLTRRAGTLKEYIETRKPILVAVKKRAPYTFPVPSRKSSAPHPSRTALFLRLFVALLVQVGEADPPRPRLPTQLLAADRPP